MAHERTLGRQLPGGSTQLMPVSPLSDPSAAQNEACAETRLPVSSRAMLDRYLDAINQTGCRKESPSVPESALKQRIKNQELQSSVSPHTVRSLWSMCFHTTNIAISHVAFADELTHSNKFKDQITSKHEIGREYLKLKCSEGCTATAKLGNERLDQRAEFWLVQVIYLRIIDLVKIWDPKCQTTPCEF
jgi:hypothetical protein